MNREPVPTPTPVPAPEPESIPGLVLDDPSPAAARANRTAIEAALDSGRSPLRLPDASVYLDKPVWWQPGRTLAGHPDGRSALRMAPGSDDGPLVLMPRDPRGVTLRPDQSPDLFGRLDATAAPAPGRRWGYRTGLDGHIAQSAGLLSILQGYWEVRRFTVELALDTTDVPLGRRGAVVGFTRSNAEPSPWFLMADQGGFRFSFRTRDGTPFGGTERSFRFPQPTARGVNRLIVQVDLARAEVGVWVDGVQVAITRDRLGDDFRPESNLVLAPNQHAPFLFGAQGASALIDTGETVSEKLDLTLAGLRLSTVPRYKVGNPGDALERLDGQPINDLNTFFRHEYGTVAYFPLDDLPGDRRDSRFLTVLSPSSRGSALLLSAAHAIPENNLGGVTLRDFAIRGGNPWLGVGVTMANTLHVKMIDLTIGDVAQPVACIGTSANYPVLIERCVLNGTDCAAMARFGMWTLRDCHSGRAGRTVLRGDRAAQIRIDGWFIEGNGNPETIFMLTDGCRVSARNIDVDFEFKDYPSVAAFYATPGGHHARRASLFLETIGFGAIPPGVPLVWLDGSPGTVANASFGMRDTAIATAPSAMVRVSDRAWGGTFGRSELISGWGAIPIERIGSGALSRIRVTE